ncbi:1-phosphatidylinositol 4,5-bisphosphate phosphodiesterase beta-2 [Amia ocellicauda]|uniref:1-phosphatidylinositol 4,5-bisphosphate phosphodiesterase beta-2 n=1 Tax=Amia ocellicauda TaxID=2972642 RepID=UPI003463AAE2
MEKGSPLEPPVVKDYLVKGDRFTKWSEDSTRTSPVMMKVDPKGFYLYWTHQNKEMEFLDIATIRDTRSGKYARIPKNQKVRNVFNLDFPDSHYLAKTLTIVTGLDTVNLTYNNFFAYKENVTQNWAADILAIVYNPMRINACRQVFLEKIYVRISLQKNKDGKIPVKTIYKMFPADKKRVEAALASAHLPKGKHDAMKPDVFTEAAYKSFIMNLCPRPEIYEIFTSYSAKAKPYMTKENFTKFINEKQRDSRLNETLYPLIRPEQVKNLIEKYEPTASNANRGQISPEGLLFYLTGPETSIVALDKLGIYQDMMQPVPHYFIKSSHNTYLTAGQFSGVSSPEMYRQCLLAGCRCLELDCWKGKPPDEEPIITHGFTMTTEILFKDVIEAIAESAFKTSNYPVILSFENHVDSVKQQEKMANYCKTIFGDALLTDPLEKYPLKPGQQIPSPAELMGKILIKNKKNSKDTQEAAKKPETTDQTPPPAAANQPQENADQKSQESPETPKEGQEAAKEGQDAPKEVQDDQEEQDDQNEQDEEKMKNSDEGTAGQEVTAYEEMSALVNYIQPNKFISFENAKKKNKSYSISSFVETKGGDLLTKFPVDFIEYNKRQMSRIYPKGTRMDSSNYNPQPFWTAGCQMVALNYQTMDFPMQLNMALFEFNGRTGYILKHDFMRRPDKKFNPFADRIDSIVASTLKIKIYSGQFLSDKNVKTGVEVELIGLPGDPKRKYKTKMTTTPNGINPVWNEEPFVFEKILLQEMASLRIVVLDEGGKFLGHRILPVHAIQSGYQHICLRTESNMTLTLPALFVYIEVKDYIPESFAGFTDALFNPLKDKPSKPKPIEPAPEQKPPDETPSEPTTETSAATQPESKAAEVAPVQSAEVVPAASAEPEPASPPKSDSDSNPAPSDDTATAPPTEPTPDPPTEPNPGPSTEPKIEQSAEPNTAQPTEPEAAPSPDAEAAPEPEASTEPDSALVAEVAEVAPVAVDSDAAPSPPVEPEKEPASTGPEPATVTVVELKQHKNFVKITKKQEKEIKDLEKKFQKKSDDLTQKYNTLFKNLSNADKKRSQKNKDGDPGPSTEKVKELKEKLQTELKALCEEQYDLVKKKKEQHGSEQSIKLQDIAKEKHASEKKALKDALDSETKEMKKKLEAKRNEKLTASVKSASDKATQEKNKKEINSTFTDEVAQSTKELTEKNAAQQAVLEKKQAATLEEIKGIANQTAEEASSEYDKKMKGLPSHVRETVNSCVSPHYPDQVDKEEEKTANGDQGDGSDYGNVYLG